jgi:hypothetical protein
MKHFSTFSFALLSILAALVKVNGQQGSGNSITAQTVDMVVVEIDSDNMTQADLDFYLDFVGAEIRRLNPGNTTARRRRLDDSTSHSNSNNNNNNNLRRSAAGDKNQNHRHLETCTQCILRLGSKTMCLAITKSCNRRELELVAVQEQDEESSSTSTSNTRDLNVFGSSSGTPVNFDLYNCVALKAEGRRSIKAAAAAKGTTPEHVFGPAVGPDNAQEYFCNPK